MVRFVEALLHDHFQSLDQFLRRTAKAIGPSSLLEKSYQPKELRSQMSQYPKTLSTNPSAAKLSGLRTFFFAHPWSFGLLLLSLINMLLVAYCMYKPTLNVSVVNEAQGATMPPVPACLFSPPEEYLLQK